MLKHRAHYKDWTERRPSYPGLYEVRRDGEVLGHVAIYQSGYVGPADLGSAPKYVKMRDGRQASINASLFEGLQWRIRQTDTSLLSESTLKSA